MKKVLIITYYWPPAGGPGVQRWLKFVKYLRDFNIEPVVYIPENPNYPIVDETFNNEIPKEISIYTHRIFEPYALASMFSKKKTKRISAGIIGTGKVSFLEKTMLWVRGNLFIPDARMFWVRPSVKFLANVIAKEDIQTIITTGPPHSVHLIGHQLKEKFKLKWVADFRDPWTSIGYHKKLKLTKGSQKKHKALEHLVLNNADKIVVTSSVTRNEFRALTKKPIEVITNGYDLDLEEKVQLDTKFTISHIGSLLSGRNPSNLWKVLAELIQENKDFKNAFELQLIGVVSADIMDSLSKYDLASFVRHIGYISHAEAVNYQRKSQVLLLVEIDSTVAKGIIPGKLFEYMAAKRPILGIGPKDWEVRDIIAETKTGTTFDHELHSHLKTVLLDWFAKYQQDKLTIEATGIEKYSRRELTGKLAAYIQWE